MAVPKRKTTVYKRGKRRSHHKITKVNLVEDKNSLRANHVLHVEKHGYR